MNQITIREVNSNDYKSLVQLFSEFATFEKTPNKMANSVNRMLAEEEHINGFVALNLNGEIIGYVTYFYAYFTWIGKSLYMDDLYVKPDYRGQGVGSKLIKKVIQFAKSNGCHKIRWQVSEWNKPAIEFYQSIGASIDSVESNCDLTF